MDVLNFAADAPEITVIYKNWRGETAVRRIKPISQWFGATEYHPEPQWLMKALDVEKGVERDFAIKDMTPAPVA